MSDRLREEKEVIKLEKLIGGEKANALRALTTDQLKVEMSKLGSAREENRRAKKDDPQLKEARAKKTELERPYREFDKRNQALMSFIFCLLEEKGVE